MMTICEMIDKLGLRNTDILCRRHDQHKAGLNMAFKNSADNHIESAMAEVTRVVHREIGDIPNCSPPNNNKYLSFLERMALIEAANSAKRHTEEAEEPPVDLRPFLTLVE